MVKDMKLNVWKNMQNVLYVQALIISFASLT